MLEPHAEMLSDFHAICATGGRLSGTASETAAVALLKRLGADASGVAPRIETTSYLGWRPLAARLTGTGDQAWPVNPLVRSPPTPDTGIEAEVIDLGRGTPEEIAAHRDEIPGRIAMVRHELMFAPGTIHRRRKIQAVIEAGAVGFLIAGPAPNATVAGSAGTDHETRIPAAGISPETGAALRRTASGRPRVHLTIAVEEAPAKAENLFFEIPGRTPEWVTLSAHIDGHDLGESAIDNASGLAVALEVTRRLAPDVANGRRGLRLALFNVEEWALTGSAEHVAALTQAQKDATALNVNLDSVAGGPHLTALSSGFAELEPFLLRCAQTAGLPLRLYRPLQMNSDHGNFAAAGIPAFRLVAGFDDPTADVRHVLTPRDTRALVQTEHLIRAAALAQTITQAALVASPEQAALWRQTSPTGQP